MAAAVATVRAERANSDDRAADQGELVSLPMPWLKHSSAGFQVPVEVTASTIKGGGLGRFAAASVKAGDVVHRVPRVSVDEFISAETAGSQENVAIEITPEGLAKLVDFFESRGGRDVCTYVSWFVAGREELTYLLGHSFHTNHPPPELQANVRTTVASKGFLEHRAIRAIEAGDEIYMSYADFTLPDYYKAWCQQRGLLDVNTLAAQLDT